MQKKHRNFSPYSPGTNSCGTVSSAEARSGDVIENASLSAITVEKVVFWRVMCSVDTLSAVRL